MSSSIDFGTITVGALIGVGLHKQIKSAAKVAANLAANLAGATAAAVAVTTEQSQAKKNG